MNKSMIGKNSMKQHYLEKKFYSNLNVEHITDRDIKKKKEFVKILK